MLNLQVDKRRERERGETQVKGYRDEGGPKMPMFGKRTLFQWFRFAWEREPVVVAACVVGLLPPFGILFMPDSWREDVMRRQRMVTTRYPVPVRDEGDDTKA
ncbi:NADH dehydrogenase [ubiquinone] 1 alpha subcomplex subunit 3 [Branchiostoma belcheri]|nr:NADH dehydrogenase [ubiquinone] 1 alpha subcomplex subunit 3 [Branchiostoma belcheri]